MGHFIALIFVSNHQKTGREYYLFKGHLTTWLGSKTGPPKQTLRQCSDLADRMQHSLGHRWKIESPIETVSECTQVAIGIHVKLQSAEGPAETGLQIAEHRINPAKFSHLIRILPFTNSGFRWSPHKHGSRPLDSNRQWRQSVRFARWLFLYAAGAPHHPKRPLRRLEPCF